MANPFDQFDQAEQPAQGAAPQQAAGQQAVSQQQQTNPFDQFDAAESAQQQQFQQPQAQAQQPQSSPSFRDEIMQSLAETGRSLLQAGANTVDIIPTVGDAIQSAAAWAGNQVGIGDGTYTPAARVADYIPESMRPQTTAGRTAAEVLPYLVNPAAGAERGAVAAGNALERIGARASGMLGENAVGALAQSSGSDDDAGDLATNLAQGVAGSVVGRGLVAGGRAAYQGVRRSGNFVRGAEDTAEAAARTPVPEGATPQQAAEAVDPGLAMRNGPDLNAQGQASRADELQQVVRESGTAAKGNAGERASFASLINPDSQVLEAARRIGVDDALTPGAFSQNPAYRAYENALGSTPNRETYHAQRQAIARVGEAADNFIRDFGGDIDRSFANDQVRRSYTGLIDNLKTQENKLYDQVRQAIPTRAPVNPDNTIRMIESYADDLGGVANLPAPMKRLLNQLSDPEATPTYGLLDHLRKEIGSAGANRGVFKDEQKATLDRLYGALTEDQGAVAAGFGAHDMWNAAKEMSRQRFAVQDAAIAGLGKDLNGDVVSKLQQQIVNMAKGSGNAFRETVNNLPDDVRQAAVVSAMNKAFTSFAKSPGQQYGVAGFTKWYNGMLRNKSNLQALNRTIGYDATRRLNDIYQVSKGLNRLGSEKVYSHSQIDKILNDFDKGGGFIDKVYQAGKRGVTPALAATVGGGATAAISALTNVIRLPKASSVEAADKLIASKSFQELTQKASAPDRVRDAAEKALLNTKAYQNWYNQLPLPDRQGIARLGVIGWLADTEQPQQQQQ